MSFEVQICRTCLSREKQENTKNILTDYLHISTYSTKVSIVEALLEITKMIVDTNESLTHRICLTCVRKLRQAYLFRIMTTKSYETLCEVNDIDQIPFKTEDERSFYTQEGIKEEGDEILEEMEEPTEEYLQLVESDDHEAKGKVVIQIKSEDMEVGEVRDFIDVTTKKHVRVVRKVLVQQEAPHKLPPLQTRATKEKAHQTKRAPHRMPTNDGTIFCDLCPATFKNIRACFIHMKKYHMSNKPYKCWYAGCGRLYKSAGQRQAHENSIHLKLKRFVCATCGMSFTDNPKLTSHTRIHTGERPYKCGKYLFFFCSSLFNYFVLDFPNCSAQFKQQYDLTKHKHSIHSTERPWICEECNATFKLKGGLRAHRRLMHSRENLKKCSDCEKEFLNVAALNNHYAIIHLGQRNHICPICERTYAYRKHMLRHVKESHAPEYQQMVSTGEIAIRMKEQLLPQSDTVLIN